MSSAPGHDPRVLANTVIKLASEKGFDATNLSIQKLLYFAHGIHLVRYNAPLVRGYFEAWPYGPVLPFLYDCLKVHGDRQITTMLTKIDFSTGKEVDIGSLSFGQEFDVIKEISDRFKGMSAGDLVNLSHAKNSPWHFVREQSKNKLIVGMRICDSLIRDRYRFHKITMSSSSLPGGPFESPTFE